MSSKFSEKIIHSFPALLVWGAFLILVILSILKPLWAVYFVLVFVIYWIVRLFYMMVWLMVSWIRYRRGIKTDWLEKVKKLPKNHRDYYHVVTYPTYKEPYEVLQRSLSRLLESKYPMDRMIVIVGFEARDENHQEVLEKTQKEFGEKFYKLITTVHPIADDELPGKGSNLNYMEREVKKFLDQKKIDYKNVIFDCFDMETIPHPQYFAYVTHEYLTHSNPTHVSYQPLILYNNNIWESNPIFRVVASATTFWLLTDLSRPEKLMTFSSHSMSFQMVVDVGYHDKTIVTDDSRIGIQGLVRYDGDYEIVPIFITLSMDTVYMGKFWHSIKNQYKQVRRWAWGVEHFPWMWDNFFGKDKNKNIPFKKRVQYLWNQTEGMFSWATAPVIILLFGRLPLWLASDTDKATAFFQNAPSTLESLMMIGMVGLVLNSIMYTFMLPTRPEKYGRWNYLIMIIQWVLFPITMVIFGSIPAIDAQTRLMLGGKWKLGFWVTEKKVTAKS